MTAAWTRKKGKNPAGIVIHQTIKRRIEALEAKEAPPIVFVWRECGESEAAALKRVGVKPGQNVVFISWQDGE